MRRVFILFPGLSLAAPLAGAADGSVSEGRCRIDEDGRYCSLWPPAEQWNCYGAMVSGTTIYWRAEDQLYPADILPGNLFEPESKFGSE